MGCDSHNNHGEDINDIVKEYREAQGTGCRLFENPVFEDIFGGAVRPGGLSITGRAAELCNIKNNDKVLDIGCGYGVTVEYLKTYFNADAAGIDLSTSLLERGKTRNKDLNLMFGDGEMMDFSSLTFDDVFIECTLSLMDNTAEALHEAYCVLKKGGKLAISDFYLKEKTRNEAKSSRTGCCGGHSHDHGDSGGGKEAASRPKKCLEGAFDPDELRAILEDIGFKILHWEDKNEELKDFTASLIMHFGSIEAFMNSTREEGEESSLEGIDNHKKYGYFLLVAEKV